MYITKIKNGNEKTTIHGHSDKLVSGNIVKGINTIDSFSFSLLPSNPGFSKIKDFSTLVDVYNTNKKRHEFQGRVLYSRPAMDESGLITKEVICESFLGYLCDSRQKYVEARNWTVRELLQTILDCHNSQVEDDKHFTIGELTVEDPNDNLYIGIQRESTWKTIEEKLIKKLGGEIRFRVVDDVLYLDYLKEIGEKRTTKIRKSKNMKSISQENDPTSFVTRLIPLGAKLRDEEGNETEDRLDITSVNDGLEYIDVEEAIKDYGIHVEYAYFDDVHSAAALLQKGRDWLVDNNRVQVKYSITALDLSLLGIDIDDLNVHDYHPIENDLLGINDTARIIKKNINVCDETSSTIEVGDKFKTLTDIQNEQIGKFDDISQKIEETKSEMKANDQQIRNSISSESISILNTSREYIMSALREYVETGDFETFKSSVESQFSVLAGEITLKFTNATQEINNVNMDLQTKYSEISKYIRATINGVEIGSTENPIKLILDNDEIKFMNNGVAFGRWDGENFYTGNIVVNVNERAQFGNFAFYPRSNGSLSFLKVGKKDGD